MTADVENLVLEQLRLMRAELQGMRETMQSFLVELGSLEVRQSALEEYSGHTQSMIGSNNGRIDRMRESFNQRLDRLEVHFRQTEV